MPRRPEIALIAPYPPPGQRHAGSSGAASYTANLARALHASGAQVTVVAPRVAGAEADSVDEGIRVLRSFGLGATGLPRAATVACALDADVVHLQWELFLFGSAALAGLPAALAHLRRAGPALVTTMHQVLAPADVDRNTTALHRVRVPAIAARLGIGTVQHMISAASDATVVHEQAFASAVKRPIVIPHGVESRPHVDRRLARRNLQLDDRFVALCFGFLAPYKGLELAADAAAIASDAVHVVFAGGDHPRLQSTERMGEELRERSRGRATITGWVPERDVDLWFSAADVALFPYPRPFAASGALALALAHGTTVLLSPALARCAGAPSPMTLAMEPLALAAQLERLAEQGTDHSTLRSNWTQTLAAGRSWSEIARRHLDLYEEVDDGRGARGRRIRAA